jgi:hypothetical protein
MPTPEVTRAQDKEGADREASGKAIPANETAEALDTGVDAGPQDPVAGDQPAPKAAPASEGDAPKAPPPVEPSFGDRKRAEITARFRTARTTSNETERDEISDFAREGGVPADFREAAGLEPEPEPEPAPAPAPQPAPAPTSEPTTIRLRVNGKDVDLPIDEVRAQAQKALASEDILGEAKTLRNELAGIVNGAKQSAARPALPTGNQGEQNPTQPTEPAPAADGLVNQEDPFAKLIETIQFGDPQEARAQLQQVVGQTASAVVQQTLVQQRLKDEGVKAAKVLTDFKDHHPELANDEMASAAIQSRLHHYQVEDLTKLGIDPTRIRQDGKPPTPGDIADFHKWLRTEGHDVRTPETMLEKARDEFLAWKGIKTEPTPEPAPAQPGPKGAPRVEITVAREGRRQEIQQQPSRTTNPRTPVVQPGAQPRDRSDVVSAMKARNAKLRGTTLGIG